MRYFILKWSIDLRALYVRVKSRIVGYPTGCYMCGDPSCYSCGLSEEDSAKVLSWAFEGFKKEEF